ncbi:DNA-binding transcriptional regulator, AcrR family [Amycolatopsis arida]|uniref:DNA-binding transcriptional regulator, AcrR family n=1 Tax=Amycolatopsis arida TaxID=587909 RepID=A0A1I5ZIE1_9PSEU|nr:TetR/AcrR family transcriptional regulator [Amycolatopsis arida]TDX89707.1 AcrR family transcriptional regulator [Amycolatopsis arida]SFQ56249.1 DNA-binding transcriptional regulator, AcrR family [Amycolatopsis arida]
MPRPREFNEQHAIDRAMWAFWAGGYGGTSTERLTEATGLRRSSLYNTFRSKHALFRRCLWRYAETATQAQLDLLASPGPARETLRALLMRVVDDESRAGSPGCLAVNTAIELGGRDDEVTADLRRDRERLAGAIREVIERGQRAGEIDRGKDAGDLAHFVTATTGGLRVLARGGADRATLTGVVEVALATL